MSDNKMNTEKIQKAMEKLQEKTDASSEQLDKLKGFAEKYKDKSEEDIFFEIIKLNNKMAENMGEEEYKRKIEKLESLRPMLSEEQSKKLDKLLEALKKSQ